MRKAALTACALLALGAAGGCRRANTEGGAPPGGDHPAEGPRIVSLAPNLTEMVCAVGARRHLVGRSDVCDWPSDVAAVPVVGSFGRPSVEAILRRNPTMILTADLEDETMLDTLESLGIAHYRIECRKLDQVPAAIREVGRLTGAAVAGQELGDTLERGIERLRAASNELEAAERPLAFVEIWGDPLMTAGRDSFVSELVRLAGCSNVADAVAAEYFTVSPEWVLKRDPEAIFCLYMSADTQAAGRVARRLGWNHVRAVRDGAVFEGFDTDLIFRPGPRVLEGVAALRDRLAAHYATRREAEGTAVESPGDQENAP